jgi:uncharacterized protein (TIGR00369 family)
MKAPLDLDTLRRFFAGAPFMADLGVSPLTVGEGQVGTELPLQPRHLQHTGQVHAGVMLSMADHSMGAAAQTLAEHGHVVITADLKISLLRAAQGERLLCDARVLKPGRRISFTEAEVFVERGGQRTLVAKASATMALTAG